MQMVCNKYMILCFPLFNVFFHLIVQNLIHQPINLIYNSKKKKNYLIEKKESMIKLNYIEMFANT